MNKHGIKAELNDLSLYTRPDKLEALAYVQRMIDDHADEIFEEHKRQMADLAIYGEARMTSEWAKKKT